MKLDKLFQGAMDAAVQGATINAKLGPRLVPVLFLLTRSGSMKIVEWQGPAKFHEADRDELRALVREQDAVGIIFIAESDMYTPEREHRDGVLIYGYLAGPRPRTAIRPFVLTPERDMMPAPVTIPPRLTDWVKDVLSDE